MLLISNILVNRILQFTMYRLFGVGMGMNIMVTGDGDIIYGDGTMGLYFHPCVNL